MIVEWQARHYDVGATVPYISSSECWRKFEVPVVNNSQSRAPKAPAIPGFQHARKLTSYTEYYSVQISVQVRVIYCVILL
jgi:hypothetical protein